MANGKWYQCKYCGRKTYARPGTIPLKTKCTKRKPSGLHVWARVD